ncbi:hypothetical protein BC332_10625 [Capsicum chinense]|nr:hypothetical protein BC332_10625 [Capsicum chinense]
MVGGEIVGVLNSFNSSKKQSHFLEDVPTSFRVPLGSQGLQLLDEESWFASMLGSPDRVLAMKWEHGLERVDSLPGRGSGVGVELMEVTFAVKSIEEGLCKFPMTDGLFSWEMKRFALKLALGEDFPHFGGVPVWAHLLGKVICEGYYCAWGLEDPAYLLRQLGSKGLRFWLSAKFSKVLHLPNLGLPLAMLVVLAKHLVGLIGAGNCWFIDAFLLRLCEENGFFGTGSRLPKASTWEQMLPKKLPSPSSAPSKGTNSVTTSSTSAKINRKLPSDDGKEFDIVHDVSGNAAEGGFDKNSSPRHGLADLDVKVLGTKGSILGSTIPGEDDFGLRIIDCLPKKEVQNLQNIKNGVAVAGSSMGEFRTSIGNAYGIPFFGIYFRINALRESLHTENKDIGRHRIPMPNALGRIKGFSSTPIYKHNNRGAGDTRHDKLSKVVGGHEIVVRATDVARGEKVPKVFIDVGLDIHFTRNDVANIISEFINPIPPSPIDGRESPSSVLVVESGTRPGSQGPPLFGPLPPSEFVPSKPGLGSLGLSVDPL